MIDDMPDFVTVKDVYARYNLFGRTSCVSSAVARVILGLESDNARLQTIATAARAVHTAYHGDVAVVSLAAAWAALEAALEEAGDGT